MSMSDLVADLRTVTKVFVMAEVLVGGQACPAHYITEQAADEIDRLRATVARQSEALKCANSALTECEAILGGEYGDHYGTLINTMLDLREKIAALAAKGET
jgi:hypothetical protein